jgi:hypothetical protein
MVVAMVMVSVPRWGAIRGVVKGAGRVAGVVGEADVGWLRAAPLKLEWCA